jgi:phosphoribosylamine--glycine ligase
MKILIVGGGGREHALVWKCAQSPRVDRLFVAPGNAGTAKEPKAVNLPIAAENLHALVEFAMAERIDLTIVGPETPLVAGIVDRFQAAGLKCFGPTQAAARLEGSKAYCKEFMARHGIPTAEHRVFQEPGSAIAYIRERGAPIVVKADGLAAGKGVIVAQSLDEAVRAVESMLEAKAFGSAGQQIVVEEFLRGEEASFIVMADGENALAMASSQDHKARDDGDRGPNTGGMGAYSPAPVVTQAVHQLAMDQVILPALRGMAAEGSPYVGFLYAGLMVSPDGSIKVLEFNCRLGDPETQPILMRLKSDLPELCMAALEGTLAHSPAEWDQRSALGVVMAAGGYPFEYARGDTVEGLPERDSEDLKIFHAGTEDRMGQVVTAGGRVLCVCALADTIAEARVKAYTQVSQIRWRDAYYRADIGHRAIESPGIPNEW